MKTYEFKTGKYVRFSKMEFSGYYCVELFNEKGEKIDRVKCDDYKMALDYKKAFCNIAKRG